MIPSFTLSGVLPPFDGTSPTVDAGRSPYVVTPEEFVATFATTPERTALLSDFFAYRARLRAAGISDGFQWIDGSFVEDAEVIKGRPPKDIDLVTFAHRPLAVKATPDWTGFVHANADIFTKSATLDSYYVDMDLQAKVVVRRAAYWFGLFSHQRVTALWKGMVQIDLGADDSAAIASLGAIP